LGDGSVEDVNTTTASFDISNVLIDFSKTEDIDNNGSIDYQIGSDLTFNTNGMPVQSLPVNPDWPITIPLRPALLH